MRVLLSAGLASALLTGTSRSDEPKQAPKVVLQSPDGKTSYDLTKLVANGPVLVRLTCACSGCDLELPYFKKLQAAYNGKGLQTIAVFREKAEALEQYAVKKGINFMWLSDPKGDLWKTFDSKGDAHEHPDRQGRPRRPHRSWLHARRQERADPVRRDRGPPPHPRGPRLPRPRPRRRSKQKAEGRQEGSRPLACLLLLPSAFCFLPSAFCLLPSAFCLLPSAFCLLPSGSSPSPCNNGTSRLQSAPTLRPQGKEASGPMKAEQDCFGKHHVRSAQAGRPWVDGVCRHPWPVLTLPCSSLFAPFSRPAFA